jgi:hypothetical protein
MASLHGYEIDCDRPLRRLSDAPGELGSIRIRAADVSPLGGRGELLHYVESRAGGPLAGIARVDGAVVAWLTDAGSFAIDSAALEIGYCRADADRPAGELRWGDRLGSTVIPLLGAERGGLALHASASLIDGQALLLCGVTGRGKSTLAAALGAAGHPLLAEDGVVVRHRDGESTVWPGMSGALITDQVLAAIGGAVGPDAGEPDRRGRRLVDVPAAGGPARVGAVAILAERRGDSVELERLGAAKAHRELLAQVLSGGRAGKRSFAAAARLAEKTPVVLARIPDRIEAIPEGARELASVAGLD